MKEKKYQEKIFEHIRMKSIEKDFISLHYVLRWIIKEYDFSEA